MHKLITSFPLLVDKVPVGSGMCLDLGCGQTAPYRSQLGSKGYRWVGVDIGINAGIGGMAVIADAHRLPFKDNVFDLVFTNQAIMCFHTPSQTVSELARTLRPGGALYGKTAFLESFNESYFHMTHRGIIKLLEEAGFEVTNVWAGANAFFLIYWGLFFHRKWLAKLAAIATWWTILTVMRMHEVWQWLRHHRKSNFRREFTSTFDLYYAGHIGFSARKPA